MSKRIPQVLGMVAMILLTATAPVFAFLDFDGNTIGLGQTHNIYDRGAWVAGWNPSLLDRTGKPSSSLQILSLGLQIGNNALSRNDYQRLFTGADRFWDNQDKQDILGQVPGNGLKGHFMMNLTGVGLSIDRFALNIHVIGATRLGIPKDFLTLALYGNELNRTYSFKDVEGIGWGATSFDFSVGKQLKWHYFDEFAVGATFRYLLGLGYAGIEKAEGGVTVTENGVTGVGNFEASYGYSGDGVGLDLAASALWNKQWEFGITLGNVIGTITWDLDSTKVYGFDVTSGEVDIDSLDNADYLDRLFQQVDTTKAGGSTKTRLPFYIQLNAGYQVTEKLKVVGEFLQGTSNDPGSSTTPRLSVGGKYSQWKWLPVRTGFAVGGPFGFEWGCGFGLNFTKYTFDFGVMGIKGLFGGSHGLGFAVTNRFIF
jgi:hypothetical protein